MSNRDEGGVTTLDKSEASVRFPLGVQDPFCLHLSGLHFIWGTGPGSAGVSSWLGASCIWLPAAKCGAD